MTIAAAITILTLALAGQSNANKFATTDLEDDFVFKHFYLLKRLVSNNKSSDLFTQ